MKLKHYSIFYKHKESKINWNYLRDNKNEPDYFIPSNEEDFLKTSYVSCHQYFLFNLSC